MEFFLGKSVDLFNREEALNDPEYYVSIDTFDRLSACVRPYQSQRDRRENHYLWLFPRVLRLKIASPSQRYSKHQQHDFDDLHFLSN